MDELGISGQQYGENNPVFDIIYNVRVATSQEPVRDLAINLTRECNSDHYCYMMNLYNYVKEFDYVYPEVGIIYPVEETIRTKSGDCKNMVVLYCSLMRSVGQECYWSINLEAEHIIATTHIDETLYIIDPASDFIMPKNSTEEFWEYIKERIKT